MNTNFRTKFKNARRAQDLHPRGIVVKFWIFFVSRIRSKSFQNYNNFILLARPYQYKIFHEDLPFTFGVMSMRKFKSLKYNETRTFENSESFCIQDMDLFPH